MKHPTPEQIRSSMLVFYHDPARRVWVVEQGIGGPEVASYPTSRDCQAHVIAGNTAESIVARVRQQSQPA